MLLALATCWGGSYLAITNALAYCSPFTVAMLRLGIASTVVGLLSLFKRIPIQKYFKKSFVILPLGLISTVVPFSLIAWAEQSIPSSLAGLINGTTPLFTTLLSFATISRSKILGVCVGFSGLSCIFLPALGGDYSYFAILAVALASLCYATGMLMSQRIQSQNFPMTVLVFYQLFYGFLILIPFSLFFEGAAIDFSWTLLGSLLYMSCVSTSFAFFLYQTLVRDAGPVYLSLSALLSPLVAVALGHILAGETLSWFECCGGLLILLSLNLVRDQDSEARSLSPRSKTSLSRVQWHSTQGR